MALFPIHARERDALGILAAHSTYAGGEGGLVVRIVAEATNPKVAAIATSGAANSKIHGLLDEQMSRPGTLIGSMLSSNSNPVVVGPATHLASGRVSVCLESGWFMTDNYDVTVDGYGESAVLAPGELMFAKSSGTVGQLTDTAGLATRVRFMKMVNNPNDLLSSRVSPAPTLGMFAQKAPILIYQE